MDTSVCFARLQLDEKGSVGGVFCVLCFNFLWVLYRRLSSPVSLMLSKWVIMIVWVVIFPHRTAFVPWAINIDTSIWSNADVIHSLDIGRMSLIHIQVHIVGVNPSSIKSN